MLDLVIDARRKDLGGFEVGRVLPFHQRRMVGPFIFLDHMGPAVFEAGTGLDVRPHPHIGLSTVTYLFEGEIVHRDSLAYTQPIRPGEVNWMTAGRGIVHSERTDPSLRTRGARMEGIQAWVALPERDEETDPAFVHHDVRDLPVAEADGVWWRLIAGEAYGAASGVKTHSPTFYLHVELQPGARLALPREHEERAAYVADGRVAYGDDTYDAGRMLVFESGGEPVLSAVTAARVMLLGGAPLGPRFIWWNLVSSRRERIEDAKADWKAGRMPLPPNDSQEFIPLPDEPMPAPEPMS